MTYPTIPPATLRDYAVSRGYVDPIADEEIRAIRRAQLVELLTNEKATPAAIAKELEITRARNTQIEIIAEQERQAAELEADAAWLNYDTPDNVDNLAANLLYMQADLEHVCIDYTKKMSV